MPTPAERQALLFVAALAALGVGVRGCRMLRPPVTTPIDRAALASQMAAVDSAVAVGGARRKAPERSGRNKAGRPMPESPREARPARRPQSADSRDPDGATARAREVLAPIDMDVAGPAELDRLPGIGPALAARIVADREAGGPFGSLKGLERVKGIGPSLASKLQPHVTFSLPPRPSDTEVHARRGVVRP